MVEDIEKFSVQLICSEDQYSKPFCSGVLVELAEHYFIFTAGHCVRPHPGAIHVKGVMTGQPFEGDVKEREGIFADWSLIEDYGFYELEGRGVEVVRGNGKLFLSQNDLHVLNEIPLLGDWTSGILSGFPISMTKVTDQSVCSRFLALNIYPEMVSYNEGNYRKCISIDLTKISSKDLPEDLEGASGGGLWIVGREKSGNPSNPKLAGINVGAPKRDGTGTGREMIVTLLGYPLRRVADLIDDVEDSIFGTWDFLRDDSWSTVHRP